MGLTISTICGVFSQDKYGTNLNTQLKHHIPFLFPFFEPWYTTHIQTCCKVNALNLACLQLQKIHVAFLGLYWWLPSCKMTAHGCHYAKWQPQSMFVYICATMFVYICATMFVYICDVQPSLFTCVMCSHLCLHVFNVPFWFVSWHQSLSQCHCSSNCMSTLVLWFGAIMFLWSHIQSLYDCLGERCGYTSAPTLKDRHILLNSHSTQLLTTQLSVFISSVCHSGILVRIYLFILCTYIYLKFTDISSCVIQSQSPSFSAGMWNWVHDCQAICSSEIFIYIDIFASGFR